MGVPEIKKKTQILRSKITFVEYELFIVFSSTSSYLVPCHKSKKFPSTIKTARFQISRSFRNKTYSVAYAKLPNNYAA